VLRECGYTVLEAPDGEAALALARAQPAAVAALVSDVVMPHVGGPELAQRLRQRWPGLRVLFMSGYGDRALPHEEDAHSDWLAKPFAPDALARKLRDLLDRPGPLSAAAS
jgi:CheY-like chemotaxis protein